MKRLKLIILGIVSTFCMLTSYKGQNLQELKSEKSAYILEFYESEYVFEGVIISEMVTEDEQNYIITFDINKHYKNEGKPKTLEFNLKLSNTFKETGSCVDRPVRLGQKWLVYAYKNENNELKFDFYCSNTKQIFDEDSISQEERKVLENGNDFSLDNYIYEFQDNFSNINISQKIESVLKRAKIKEYKKKSAVLLLKINKEGILESVANDENYSIEVDQNFNLIKSFKVINKIDLSEFDKEAITLVKKIKNFGIKYHKKTKTPVVYIERIIFQYDKKNNTWSYEL